MDVETTAHSAEHGRARVRPAYKHYLLVILLLIYAFNYVDRLALGLMLEDIKRDLDLTDTQLGFMSGIAFALFYSVMGVPIARWADRGNRVLIISVTAGLWSTMVALCGWAGSFLQLLLIRIGVGVGEAGCVPPAHSLIADYFRRAERPRAVSVYLLGGPLSYVIGYLVAGWLNELFGWRTTFMLIGVPGVVLAILAWFTLREPRLAPAPSSVVSGNEGAPAAPAHPSLREVCAALWRNHTFRHLLACISVVYFFGYGILQWKPAFFIRSYGLDTRELGLWFALIYGGGGLLGMYCGGEWASRRAANNETRQLKYMGIAYCVFGVLSAAIYVSPNPYLAFTFLALSTFGVSMISGPLFAIIQTLVPPRMRAVSVALIYLFANLVGMGLGPLAAGAMSDAFRGWVGEESLRYALLALCPGYFWAGWHLWRGSRTVAADLDLVRGDEEAERPRPYPGDPAPAHAEKCAPVT